MKRKAHEHLARQSRRDFLQNSSLTLLGLAGSGLSGITWAVEKNQLHVRNYMDMLSLDPVSTVSGAEGLIMGAIYQNLLHFVPDGSWVPQPDAAEWFEQRDSTHYDFRLKPGQMFNNGFGEMTADDVKFSFERMVDPAMNAINRPDMGPLSHVDVHDRYSGTIVLSAPYAALIPIAVAGPAGSILSRKAVTALGGRFTSQPPCGSGPYAFQSWQAQRKTILVRNPQWSGEPAAFEEMHIYPLVNDKAAEMAFEAGQLDCTNISVETVGPFEQAMPPDSSIRVLPSGRNFWLGINQQNPALTDIRVRQAIQYAVDVEAIMQAAWFGLATVSTGPVPEGMIGHRAKSLVPPRGDLDKARALLKDAGVSLPLHLSLDVDTRPQNMAAAQVIQWSLKKAGIEVTIHAHENATFITLGREDLGADWRKLQLFLQNFIGLADPYYSITWFISAQLGLWNWERLNNAEFDKLNDAALATDDAVKRDRMYQRMQDIMEESGCYRFLTNGAMPLIYRNSIVPTLRPDGYALLRDFHPSSEAG